MRLDETIGKNDKKSDEMKRERMQSEKREERTGEERIRKENSSLKKNERMEWKLDYKKKSVKCEHSTPLVLVLK